MTHAVRASLQWLSQITETRRVPHSLRVSLMQGWVLSLVPFRIYGAGDGNRTHVRSLGRLLQKAKNAQIGGILSFFEVLKWIPTGAA